jgi:hypothetical protein
MINLCRVDIQVGPKSTTFKAIIHDQHPGPGALFPKTLPVFKAGRVKGAKQTLSLGVG